MESLSEALGRGVLPAADLRERLGISPPTLMRTVRNAADVVRLGRGPATRYALRREWPGLDRSRFPIFRIGADGTAQSAGELVTLAARQSVWLPAEHIENGLPIELMDARPAGFLGRHFASIHADLRLPSLLTDWSDHHVLLAMSRRGEDLPGNLIIGEESFARWQALDGITATHHDYPALATATIAGHPPGSSAGGERPKFGVLVDGRHMLVKFAARGTAADHAARRWCDLLILEGLALDVIESRGIPAAHTTVLKAPSHYFLESERFDRVGPRGRRGVLSLAAIHDDPADSWARAAVTLSESGRITEEDARRLRWLDAFGALIGNTDRHQYNLLFFVDSDDAVVDDRTQGATQTRARVGNQRRLPQLAPVFDQVSMLYAPTADGLVPSRTFVLPAMTSHTLDVWDDAQAAARLFWQQAGDNARVSDDVRTICRTNAELLASRR